MRNSSRYQILLAFFPLLISLHPSLVSGNSKPRTYVHIFKRKKPSKIKSIATKLSEAKKSTNAPPIDKEVILYITRNSLAGLASAIALIPEASTFAITAGLSPLVGLGSTVVLATFSGVLGGRPGLVSGASATVSLILKPLCEQHGHAVMSLAVFLAGLLQIGLGMTKCSKYIRVVPRPVMLGFVNGLAMKVVLAQIPHFQHPHGVWLKGDALKWHSILVIASALIIDTLPKLTSAVPSPLAALGITSLVTKHFDLPVPRLVDMVGPEAFYGGLDTLKQALFPFIGSSNTVFPFAPSLMSREALAAAIPTAVEMAVVGLLQSLLTLQIIDSKTYTYGKNTKETIAQGLGNLVSGALGGMGGSALLGQSLVNVNSGGTGRLSSCAVAVFVLGGVTFFAPILGQLPVAALVGLMFTVAQHTFSWGLFEDVFKGQVPWVDICIIALVSWTTAFVNMAVAVAIGVLASALRFAWQASCNMSAKESGFGTRLKNRYIRVQGPLFFGSSTTFGKLCGPSDQDREVAAKIRARMAARWKKKANSDSSSSSSSIQPTTSPVPFKTGRETVIDFLESQVWDHAAIMAIETLAQEYHDLGVKLRLRHLSPDCREKLLESSDIDGLSTELDVDSSSDPNYLVGEDPKTKI